MRASYLFTSESVSEGHPDKVSDQISDAILDAFIEKDVQLGIADDSLVNTRLGCETLCTTNKIIIAGEGRGQLFRTIHGKSVVDRELITQIARDVVKDIGYDQNGFSYHGADVEVLLHGQSPDIAMGVNAKKSTPGLIKDMIADAVESALPKGWMPAKSSDFLVNPTGNFVVGGPDGDCGLTGRKIIVDTYGGYAPHGGGAFSGKDPTKVDRSAAYAARYLAKNVVAAGLAERCTIQLAYAIGVADPMSLLVDMHGTGAVDERKVEKVLPQIFPLRPTSIRRALKLSRPIYRRTAAYGHFGRPSEKDGGFSWERTDLADPLSRPLS